MYFLTFLDEIYWNRSSVFFLPWVANYNVQGARMATDENLNLNIQSTIFSVELFISNTLKLRSSLFF